MAMTKLLEKEAVDDWEWEKPMNENCSTLSLYHVHFILLIDIGK
jgi:hypothetical protein